MRIILAVLLAVMAGGGSAQAQTRIDWRLENPFRLFKKPALFQRHAAAFAALKPHERRMPIISEERALSLATKGRGWAEEAFNDTCYNQNSDAYDGCKDYVLPKSHRIVARLVGTSAVSWVDVFRARPGPNGGTCRWTLQSAAGKTLSGKTGPCIKPVTLDVPWPTGGRLSVMRDGENAAPTALIKVRDVLVLAMGDSFGAGEGNPDDPTVFNDAKSYDYGIVNVATGFQTLKLDGYPAREGKWDKINTDAFDKYRARWWDRECHRSLYSHQARVALQLAVEDPKRAVTFLSFACTGAEINDGLFLKKPVRECTAGEAFTVPPQFGSAARALCKATQTLAMPQTVLNASPELKSRAEADTKLTRCKPGRTGRVTRGSDLKRPVDLVLLSVGGNDSGFVGLVSDSILSDQSIYRILGKRMGQIYDTTAARARLATLKTRFAALGVGFETLLGLSAVKGEQRRVILTGYPHMGYSEGGLLACGGNKGLEVFPPFTLNAVKVAAAENFTTELNATLKTAAVNWTFVDGHRADFRTHGLCATASGGGTANLLGFPRFANGAWTPFKPSEFIPYTPRQRWHRTPNDAFLIANMHSRRLADFGQNCSGLWSDPLSSIFSARLWTPFQIFLASTYGGAFHPTAEGQARIADEVLPQARAILAGTPR